MWLEVQIAEPDDEGNAKLNGVVGRGMFNSDHIWGIEPLDGEDLTKGCKLFTTTGVGFMIKDSYNSIIERLGRD